MHFSVGPFRVSLIIENICHSLDGNITISSPNLNLNISNDSSGDQIVDKMAQYIRKEINVLSSEYKSVVNKSRLQTLYSSAI